MCEVGSQFLIRREISSVRRSTVLASHSLSIIGIIEPIIAVAIRPNLLAASTA